MAVYRQVQNSFWQDKFVLDLEPQEKLFYLWILTNPKVNQSGCYEISSKITSLETGLSWKEIETFIKHLETKNKIKFDALTSEILIINWLKYNGSTSPKILQNIKENIANIKNFEFKKYCIDTLSILYGKGIDTHTQETEEETEEELKEETEEELKTKTKEFVNFSENDEKLLTAFGNFEKMRNKIRKPLTQRACELICIELARLAPKDKQMQVAILDQSTKHCWQDVYPYKHKNAKNKNTSGVGDDLEAAAMRLSEPC